MLTCVMSLSFADFIQSVNRENYTSLWGQGRKKDFVRINPQWAMTLLCNEGLVNPDRKTCTKKAMLRGWLKFDSKQPGVIFVTVLGQYYLTKLFRDTFK